MPAELPVVTAYKKWDRYLLLNHPWLWALRLPLLGVYFVFNAIVLMLTTLIPLQTYHINYLNTWLWLLSLVELTLLVLWIRRFNQFTPEKDLERPYLLQGMAEIVIYILCILVFLLPTVVSSFVLDSRFTQMIPDYGVLQYDSAISNPLQSQVKDIFERYSRMDYETYLELEPNSDERNRVDQQINATIYYLQRIYGHDESFEVSLSAALWLLNLSVLLYSYRHIRKGVLGKAIVVGIVLYISLYLASQVTHARFSEPFHYFEHYRGGHGLFVFFFAGALTAVILYLSVRVFWQKSYQTATAVSITLLPYVFYVWLFSVCEEFFYKNPILKNFWGYNGILDQEFGFYMVKVGEIFLLKTPLIILWVFIFTKAMYTRLLALPEG